jgi:hypothetical protein
MRLFRRQFELLSFFRAIRHLVRETFGGFPFMGGFAEGEVGK